jgi:hypothetical protein
VLPDRGNSAIGTIGAVHVNLTRAVPSRVARNGSRRADGLDLYGPAPDDNPLKVDKIELGRRLFTDRRLWPDGTIACASCHDPARAFSGGRVIAVGVFGRTERHNAPAIINRGYGRRFFWDARVNTLEERVLRPIQDPNEMDLPVDEAAARVGLDRTTLSQTLSSPGIASDDAPQRRVSLERRGVNADRLAFDQAGRAETLQDPRKHGPVRFERDESPRPRNRRVIWRRLVQPDPQEIAQRQRIRHAPGDAALGIDALEIVDPQQPKMDPWRQSGPAHRLRIKAGALRFDEIVESMLAQQLIQAPNGSLAAVGESVVGTHIVGCRSRLPLPIAMGKV